MAEEANHPGTPKVFRNEVVLREVFKYLPTSTLISSCSLVNRLWRKEAFSFIRDYRECVVKVGVDSSATLERPTNLWRQLCELDRNLGRMTTVPFNSLRVLLLSATVDCGDIGLDINVVTNFLSRFRLKYLSVLEDPGAGPRGHLKCPPLAAIIELVRENSSTLEELEIRSSMEGTGCAFKYWEPPRRFDNLKKLSIARSSSITLDCVKTIIRGALRLEAIHSNCHFMIPDVVPENMYTTLKRLVLDVTDVGHVEKFADKLDHLEELVVNFNGCHCHERALKIQCVGLFQKLLALNSLTLCSLGMRNIELVNWLDELELPLLASVEVMFISVWEFSPSLHYISELNFRVSLPNLRKLYIMEGTCLISSIRYDGAVMDPDEDVQVAPNASETTMELAIEGSISPSNLLTLRKLYPNLIRLSVGDRNLWYFPPLGFIGSLWPNLQFLSSRSRNVRENIVVAEVFGLHLKEWKLLRQQDKDFLKRVQLASSRPCVLNMRALKRFNMEYGDERYAGSEASRQFLEPLVMGRKPGLCFKMKRVLTQLSWTIPRFKDLGEEYWLVKPFMKKW